MYHSPSGGYSFLYNFLDNLQYLSHNRSGYRENELLGGRGVGQTQKRVKRQTISDIRSDSFSYFMFINDEPQSSC